MHFRKKDGEFFSQIFKKLQKLANFFTALLKVIFKHCGKIWSYAPYVKKSYVGAFFAKNFYCLLEVFQ